MDSTKLPERITVTPNGEPPQNSGKEKEEEKKKKDSNTETTQN